jgi:hypothetical protein
MLQAAEELHLLLVPAGKTFHVGDAIRVTWLLENRSKGTLSVVAYHDGGGPAQFDELNLQVSRNNGPWQTVSFARPGSTARVIWRNLDPGATLFQQFDLAAAMSDSGLKLEPGSYRLKGEYSLASQRTDTGHPSWSGHVATDQMVTFDLN